MKKSIFWLKKLAKAAKREARIHRDDTYTEGTCKYCNAVLVHHRMAKKKIFCSQRCRLAWWAIEHGAQRNVGGFGNNMKALMR